MKTKNYFPEIDIVKGFAILLVILGHSFCTSPINLYEHFPVFGGVVRSFQMPLFFIVSGFLFSAKYGLTEFLTKKTKRLVTPWLVFSALAILLRFAQSMVGLGKDMSVATELWKLVQGQYYWFLYSLMWIMILCNMVKNKKVLAVIALSSVMLCLLTDIKSVTDFNIGRTVYYFAFFVMGFLFRDIYGYVAKANVGLIGCTVLLMLIGFVSCWQFISTESVYWYIIPLLGSFTVWGGIICIYQRFNCIALRHFGKYSLQYYCNHLLIMFPCYYIGSKLHYPLLSLLVIFLLGIAISYVMLQVEIRVKPLRALCGLN